MKVLSIFDESKAGLNGPSVGQRRLRELVESRPSLRKRIVWRFAGKVPFKMACGWSSRVQLMRFCEPQESVAGPNIFFGNYKKIPCDRVEATLAKRNMPLCLTDAVMGSRYWRLITKHTNCRMVMHMTYPVAQLGKVRRPQDRPYDMLFVYKSGYTRNVEHAMRGAGLRVKALFYGAFDQETLAWTASRAKCAVYLSSSDRNSILANEINALGTPIISTEEGWPQGDDQLGEKVGRMYLSDILAAYERIRHRLKASDVGEYAMKHFGPDACEHSLHNACDYLEQLLEGGAS